MQNVIFIATDSQLHVAVENKINTTFSEPFLLYILQNETHSKKRVDHPIRPVSFQDETLRGRSVAPPHTSVAHYVFIAGA
jgi:hypothetical protein